MKKMYSRILLLAIMVLTMASCRIEPPLNLPSEDVVIENPIIVNELEVIWDIDVSWKIDWVYEWDEEDSANWGPIAYPEPTRYNVYRFFLGELPGVSHAYAKTDGPFEIRTNRFERKYNFGWYDILIYSLIDSPDFTQNLIVDDSDLDDVIAYTHSRSVRMYRPKAGLSSIPLYNQPEIFYSAFNTDIHITHDPNDYDYFDEERKVWVKKLESILNPLVYIYLVQVILHHNNGRVVKVPEVCAIDGLADKTSVTFGNTSENDVSVNFPMRLKQALDAKKYLKPDEKTCDVIGGKLTTFGLCGMPPWVRSRSAAYVGSRADVKNNFALNMQFANGTDSTYYYNVTDQFQSRAHGGVITVEIDVDTLKIPVNPRPPGGGSGFDPYVAPYDTVVHEFNM